jgi:5-carboxymethyl-2-hydroxymuconate isomerase
MHMPHLVVEYSRNVEDAVSLDTIMDLIYRSAANSGVMDSIDIKVRAIPYVHFKLADSGNSFIHVTCRLLSGRSEEQKSRLTNMLRQDLIELLPDVHSISVEVVDMDPASYKKRLLDIDR